MNDHVEALSAGIKELEAENKHMRDILCQIVYNSALVLSRYSPQEGEAVLREIEVMARAALEVAEAE